MVIPVLRFFFNYPFVTFQNLRYNSNRYMFSEVHSITFILNFIPTNTHTEFRITLCW